MPTDDRTLQRRPDRITLASSGDLADIEGVSEPATTILPVPRGADRIPALDGVRGVAVLWVMLFHFTWTHADKRLLLDLPYRVTRYGDRGVDLFFVLSGFLITSVLLKLKASEPKLGGYLRVFYWRRTLRIFPLYYFALAIFLLVVPHFIDRAPQTRDLLGHQWMLWLYVSNIGQTFVRGDLFDAGPIRLLHFWSLAIEEQFYLCWPIVVWLCSRRGVLIACALAAIVSLASTLLLIRLNVSNAPWQFTTCRFQALCAGAAMAVLLPSAIASPRVRRGVAAVAIVGLSALVIFVLGDLRPRMAGYSNLAIARAWSYDFLTDLGMAAGVGWLAIGGFGSRAVANRFLIFFGKYSYGLYVWHYAVVMSFSFKFLTIGQRSPVLGVAGAIGMNIVVGICASVVLALLSWNLIERPILSLKDRFRRPMLASANTLTAP